MKTKKISYTLDGHHITFAIVFSPLKLGSYEVLSVNGTVIAQSEPSRVRRQNQLTVDYVIDEIPHRITAISAPMTSGLKQGIQLRIDNQIVSGDVELDISEVLDSPIQPLLVNYQQRRGGRGDDDYPKSLYGDVGDIYRFL